MNFLNKRVLRVDLSKHSFEIKTYPELHDYLGGLALGLKLARLYASQNPLIFAVGPLNGFFPLVSKTCLLDYSENLEEFYIGGSLSHRIRFAGFDAIVFSGVSPEPVFLDISADNVDFIESSKAFSETGLPGRSSKLAFKKKLLLDDYFYTAEDLLGKAFIKRNLGGINITATQSIELEDTSRYEKLYTELLLKAQNLHPLSEGFPSCTGCPFGCSHSQVGERTGNVLVHSLVACETASPIYSDLGVVFSCLNALGYDYTHEELERLPGLIKDLFSELEEK